MAGVSFHWPGRDDGDRLAHGGILKLEQCFSCGNPLHWLDLEKYLGLQWLTVR